MVNKQEVALTDDELELLRIHVAYVAPKIAKRFTGYISADDVRQELWIWLLSNPRRYQPLLEAEAGGEREDSKRERQYLQRNLYRAGSRWAHREKAKNSGYDVSDLTFYTRGLIETLLSVRFGAGEMPNILDANQARAMRSLAEGMTLETMLADIDVAVSRLTDEYKNILVRVYGLGVSIVDVANEQGISRQAVEKKIRKGMNRVIDHLGGESPFG